MEKRHKYSEKHGEAAEQAGEGSQEGEEKCREAEERCSEEGEAESDESNESYEGPQGNESIVIESEATLMTCRQVISATWRHRNDVYMHSITYISKYYIWQMGALKMLCLRNSTVRKVMFGKLVV